MKVFLVVGVVVLVAVGGAVWYFSDGEVFNPSPVVPNGVPAEEPVATEAEKQTVAAKSNEIRVTSVSPGDTVASPLEVSGEARGYWFFEGSFPVRLLNRNGQMISQGIAKAQGDWMTEDMVPFRVTLEYTSPYVSGDPVFMGHGTLVLVKDNPSDLPENDDSLRIPLAFEPNTEVSKFAVSIPSPVTIYDGIEVMDNNKSVDLSNRGLSGSLKAEIRLLTKLETLDISGNNFTGLPAEVGQLSELRTLNLANNPLAGLPHELGNLSKLRTLDLRGTDYSEYDLEIISSALPSYTNILTDNSAEQAATSTEEAEEETEE